MSKAELKIAGKSVYPCEKTEIEVDAKTIDTLQKLAICLEKKDQPGAWKVLDDDKVLEVDATKAAVEMFQEFLSKEEDEVVREKVLDVLNYLAAAHVCEGGSKAKEEIMNNDKSQRLFLQRKFASDALEAVQEPDPWGTYKSVGLIVLMVAVNVLLFLFRRGMLFPEFASRVGFLLPQNAAKSAEEPVEKDEGGEYDDEF